MNGKQSKRAVSVVAFIAFCLLFALPSWARAETVINMKYSTFTGPSHPMYKTTHELIKELEKASGGTVKIAYYGAEALGKAKEHYELTKEGLADMATFCCSYTPAQFPISALLENPFFSNTGETATEVGQELFEKGLISDEFRDVQRLFTYSTPPSYLFSNKKIEKKEDFRGMRIIGGSLPWNNLWRLLGATGVSMGYPDIYLALQRGTLDAGATSWSASSFAWKWPEVVKYPTDIALMGGFHCGWIMNKNSWAKLSPDVQKAWLKVFDKYRVLYAKTYESFEVKGKQAWVNAGRKIITVSPKEQERIAEAAVPVYQEWIEKNEAAGRPAKKAYQVYLDVMKKRGEPVLVKVPGFSAK